jgi:hypothetical protein
MSGYEMFRLGQVISGYIRLGQVRPVCLVRTGYSKFGRVKSGYVRLEQAMKS